MTGKRTPSTSQSTTPRTPKLSDKQCIALEAELAGQSTSEAATLAGVTRQTVSEWRNHHPEYRAARHAAVWDHLGDITMKVRRDLLALVFEGLTVDMASEDPKVRQRARVDLLRYERQLPEPPPADPDLERDAEAHRAFVTALGGMQTVDEMPR